MLEVKKATTSGVADTDSKRVIRIPAEPKVRLSEKKIFNRTTQKVPNPLPQIALRVRSSIAGQKGTAEDSRSGIETLPHHRGDALLHVWEMITRRILQK